MVLAAAASAYAEPCGDVSFEGKCDGNTRVYCNADELRTEECEQCCGWDGNGFDCLGTCPAAGECIEECLDGVDVFGCSLLNTHEWTCENGANGCTNRIYVKCGPDQICDEAGSHKCTAISEVDLCGGISEDGKCDGNVAKICVGGQVQTTDCGDTGQSCHSGKCVADCPIACLAGESGCADNGQAWSCQEDRATGCMVKASKNCGVKVCHEGKCVFASELEAEGEGGDAGSNVAEGAAVVDAGPAPVEESSGGCTVGRRAEGLGEMGLIILVTLLGFLLFLTIARRRSGRRGRHGGGQGASSKHGST